MTTIYLDSTMSDDERRSHLYQGDLFIYSPTETTLQFCEFAQNLIGSYFTDGDPQTAQHRIEQAEYAEILGRLKPEFIHHPKSKTFIQKILNERGIDLSSAYFEVPKMRSSTSDEFITAGIAYAWHPHRDTWYSAPQCQINWWMPIFDITAENTMAFYPKYWGRVVENNSEVYNYYEWNEKYRGAHVTKYLNSDPRPLPKPTEQIDTSEEIKFTCPIGGIYLFSGAHLHGSVNNTSGKTRFSLDFRTINIDDLNNKKGAPNLDSNCSGSVLGEFLSARDLTQLPESILKTYHDGTEERGRTSYKPIS
jgi:hypothetical protein